MAYDYDIYLFDLDGTLLNTLDDLACATNYALRTHGLPERTTDEVRMFVGNGVRKLIERAVGTNLENTDNAIKDAERDVKDVNIELVLTTFRGYYASHSMDLTRPYNGIMETLEELKRRGKKIAVVSNKFYDATQSICRHYFPDLVDIAIGEREPEIRKKPAPDMVQEALRVLTDSARPTDCNAVYIGDSDVDIATAKNSELPCISVLWGFRDKTFLEQNGATTFIAAPKELLQFF